MLYNFIHSKLVIIPVVLFGFVCAAFHTPAVAIFGAVLIYGYLAVLIVTAIARYGLSSAHVQGFLIDKAIQLGMFSLILVPVLYMATEKLTKYEGMTQAELRADSTNAAVAHTLCPEYFRDGFPQSYIANWNLRFCEAFPEYDTKAKVAAVSVDQEATGSTKAIANGLWK